VDFSASVQSVASHMAEHRLGSALVTKNGKLAGVFTSTDACRVLDEYLEAQFGSNNSDAAA